ncbi:MAG TPA: efflux RND transporter periplasmic adaptor subunit [Candidatus Micrarchaeia archaeon]|nr:efflux RND transporter periplasmic adaptor subunit [Candidatus Micrarchaeia archaeon]
MKYKVNLSKRDAVVLMIAASIVVATGLLTSSRSHGQTKNADALPESGPASNAIASEMTLELSPSQLNAIKIASVGSCLFPVDEQAVGNIDFDGNLSVQVFPLYQGTILKTLAELGAEVHKDEPLYTIKSPDLIQAESTLIGAAATFELTSKELDRAKSLNGTNGVSQRELEQATSDEQTAEGALKAARDAVRVFGKTDAEIDQMISSRKIDPALVVRSPISGKVTSKNAQPGFLVQPGNNPAPYSVADVSIKWMLAGVIESDIPLFRLGQQVQVQVMAYPDRVFKGKVSKIYSTVDPNTHRVTIRSEIADPKDELRPGMLANFVIRVHDPIEATAIPANGVVRESDGSMTAWVTSDRRHFVQRVVSTGLRRDGQVQILNGLHPGELVVTDGAVFLSNMLEAPPSD